jgi:hypothetical protein
MNEIALERTIPIFKDYDVVVVGGGPSGICAAVCSARCGTATALLERYGALGGNLTVGHVGPPMGSVSDGTIQEEVNKMIKGNPPKKRVQDFEHAKTVLSNWVVNEGVDLILQSPVVDVVMENNVIKGVVIGTTSGMNAVMGQVVVDATGDGTVSYLAGANYEKGRKSDGLMQPVSLMFTVSGVDETKAITCVGLRHNPTIPVGRYLDICEKARQNGILPENVSIVRLYRSARKGERIVNATQENGIDATKISDVTKAEMNLRNQINKILEFLREQIPGFENVYVKDSASTLGVRETRRILGEYILKDADLENGIKFDDVVVHDANFPIDIHNPSGPGQAEGLAARVMPYDIPYRCLVPLNVENLLTAGRCISGTHRAHASYRTINICMAIGQAAGIAAALSAKEGIYPRSLDHRRIQKVLINSGVKLN